MLKKIFTFYLEIFQRKGQTRKLWIIIFIKLFILFVFLKIFFFRDFLKSRFSTEQQKSNYVIEQLTKSK